MLSNLARALASDVNEPIAVAALHQIVGKYGKVIWWRHLYFQCSWRHRSELKGGNVIRTENLFGTKNSIYIFLSGENDKETSKSLNN